MQLSQKIEVRIIYLHSKPTKPLFVKIYNSLKEYKLTYTSSFPLVYMCILQYLQPGKGHRRQETFWGAGEGGRGRRFAHEKLLLPKKIAPFSKNLS